MRRFSLASALALVVSGCSQGVRAAHGLSFMAHALNIKGTITVRRVGQAKVTRLKERARLKKGDVVHTGADGKVRLHFNTGHIVNMGANRTYKIGRVPSGRRNEIPDNPGAKSGIAAARG